MQGQAPDHLLQRVSQMSLYDLEHEQIHPSHAGVPITVVEVNLHLNSLQNCSKVQIEAKVLDQMPTWLSASYC